MAKGLNFSVEKNTWAYFTVFLVSSFFLSYITASLSAKIFIFIFGIAIPLFAGIAGTVPQPYPGKDKAGLRAFSAEFPIFFLVITAAAGVFIRFFRLETLSVWPVLDEGRNAFFAMELGRQWDWKFFHDISQMPPLYYWLLGLFFKVLTPSLFSLWLFPALLSLCVVPAGYLAAKQFFSKNEALLLGCLLSVGFYPAYVGRFNHQAILLLLCELFAFLILGKLLSVRPGDKKPWMVLLGLCLGAGFYIFFAWPFVALGVGIIAWMSSGGWRKTLLALGGSAFLISVLPIVAAGFHEGYGSYLQGLAAGGGRTTLEWLTNSFSYLTGLFWGVETEWHAYKPFWGGFLNPLMTSCFWIGFLEVWRRRQTRLPKALLGLLGLFLLPAFASKEIEMFRIVQVLPVLFVFVGVGFQALAARVPKDKAIIFAGAFLILSSGLDFYHLAGPYHEACASSYGHWASYSKSVERWRAYQILKKISVEQGPGYIFSNFDPYPFDKSLAVATAPFNLEDGKNDSIGGAKWAALLTNVNNRPFLAKRFPEARFEWLAPDISTMDGGLMLAVLPVGSHRADFIQWSKANQGLKPVTDEILNRPFGENRETILKDLAALHPIFKGDAFLESVYGNLMYLNHSAERQWSPAKADLIQMSEKGYASAYVFNELGGLLAAEGDRVGAMKAFEKAVHCEVNHTPARENLLQMNRQ